MTISWAKGAKGLAIGAAFALSIATATEGQPAAPAVASAAPAAAAATPAPAPAELPASLAGYTRTVPTPNVGQPIPGPAGYDVPAQFSTTGHEAAGLMNYFLNPLIIAITLFVFVLLAWVVLRYRSSVQAEPSKRTHNFPLEVAWTLIPALILLIIAFPSFRLIATQYNPPPTDMTVKVTGHQWYWSYEYPDYGDINFDSVLMEKEDAEKAGDPYMLDVDNRLVVPAGKRVKVLITGADVVHSWAVPSLWVKMDAVPGKINQVWFQVDRPGVYYGQCSELCGVRHGFMPIAVEVLPEEDFKRWVRMKQQEDGIPLTGPGIPVAATAAPAAQPQIDAGAPAAAPAA